MVANIAKINGLVFANYQQQAKVFIINPVENSCKYLFVFLLCETYLRRN